MSASAADEPAKLPEKDIAYDEVVEIVELSSQENVRRVVETAFANAKLKLARSRENKIRENLAKAALDKDDKDDGDDDAAMDAIQKNSMERPWKSVHAVLNPDIDRFSLKKVDIPPPGVAWVRVQANVSVPGKYGHDFHVPYLGESEAKIKSSNTLAMDLFQQEDLDDEDNDSEIEEYADYLLHQCQYAFHIADKSEKNFDLAKKEGRSSRGKGPSPTKRNVQKKRLKHSMPMWDRAVKRVALKEIMNRLGLDSTESIEDTVCDVFRLRSPRQAAAYWANVSTRVKLWKRQDDEESGKLERHAEVVKHALREVTTCANEVLKSESITFFVCRQCYTYVCSLHGYQHDARPIKKPIDKSRKVALTPQAAAAIEAKCEDRESGNCWCTKPNPVDASEWVEQVKANPCAWSDVHSVVREVFETFGHDPCRTSAMMRAFLPSVDSEVHFTCCRVGYLCEQLFSEDSDAKKSLGRNYSRPKKPQNKWSKSRVRRPAQEIESMQGGRRLDYVPCRHEGACTMKNCVCVQSGLLCEKFCGCNHNHVQQAKPQVTCSNAYRGCTCKSTAACASKACICFSMNRECDPDLCRQCHEYKEGPPPDGKRCGCLNEGLRMNEKHRTVVGHSKVHGWGVFAVSDIPKNEIIGEYVGELIKQEEAERRGRVYDEINYSFLFNTTKDYALDSTRLGNKLRYCNHSIRPNCEPKVMRVGGDVRVGLYAKRHIAKNEELFFNYGYNDGPAWAMQGQTKGGSANKKSVTGKRKYSSDGDSDEVLPISSRRRKSLDHELSTNRNPNADMKFRKRSPTEITRSQKRKKRNEDELVLIPMNVSDDEVVPGDDVATCQDGEDNKPSQNTGRAQNVTPPAPGRSVWRGILKRVSVGAADVESPGRRLPNANNGRNRLEEVPQLNEAVRRAQSNEYGRLTDGERQSLLLGKASASTQKAEKPGRAISSRRWSPLDGRSDAKQQSYRRERKARKEERSSDQTNGAADLAVNDALVQGTCSSGVKNERKTSVDEGEAALREVFGSDCEVESDMPPGQSVAANGVKVPEVSRIQRNGIRRDSRSPASEDDADSDHEPPGSERKGHDTSKGGESDEKPIAGRKIDENANYEDGDELSRKRRYPSSSATGNASKHSDYAEPKHDDMTSSKRLRLLGNAAPKSSRNLQVGNGGSVHNKRARSSKLNGSKALVDDRADKSLAKRRLFPPSSRPRSEEPRSASHSQPRSSSESYIPSQSRPSGATKRRERGENGQASSTDDDGTEEVVPVVNLVSDDDDDRERNGNYEPNFSNWFM